MKASFGQQSGERAGPGRPARFIDRQPGLLRALQAYGMPLDEARLFLKSAKAEGLMRFEITATAVPAGLRLDVPVSVRLVWQRRGWFVDVYLVKPGESNE